MRISVITNCQSELYHYHQLQVTVHTTHAALTHLLVEALPFQGYEDLEAHPSQIVNFFPHKITYSVYGGGVLNLKYLNPQNDSLVKFNALKIKSCTVMRNCTYQPLRLHDLFG